jgi:hypothetical protein
MQITHKCEGNSVIINLYFILSISIILKQFRENTYLIFLLKKTFQIFINKFSFDYMLTIFLTELYKYYHNLQNEKKIPISIILKQFRENIYFIFQF